MTTKHGSEPRGLEAVKKQGKRGYLPEAEPPFGSRFGRLFDAATEKGGPTFSDAALAELAKAMVAKFDEPKDGTDPEESGIPALYTYFGQFIDHDLTFDPEPNFKKIKDARAVIDFRTAAFDLDNVYGRGRDDQPFMYDGDKFLLGVRILGGSPHGAGAHDLARNSLGRALIGDPRNDENSIVSQLQGVFHRFHNRAIEENKEKDDTKRFNDTQRMVRDHYQYVVMNDFLPKIVSGAVLASLKTNGRWDPAKLTLFTRDRLGEAFQPDYPFMPVEFSVAAYRLGHSMVRPGYRLNDGTLEAIFPVHRNTGRNFPEGLTGFRALITDWAIDWARFIDVEERDYGPNPDNTPEPTQKQIREMFRRLQFAYRIDTSLVDPLGSLPPSVAANPGSLALRNLQRGEQFRLPTGQEIARKMGIKPLDDEDILIGKAVDTPGKGEEPVSIATIAGDSFKGKCPLWTYILAEAAQNKTSMDIPAKGAPGKVSTPQLGPVGGRIVAETFLALLNADQKSFLHGPDWKPNGGKFGLRQLVMYGLGETGTKLAPRP
jgi:Animal haem peroxidase